MVTSQTPAPTAAPRDSFLDAVGERAIDETPGPYLARRRRLFAYLVLVAVVAVVVYALVAGGDRSSRVEPSTVGSVAETLLSSLLT